MAGTSGLPHQAPHASHPKRVCNTITRAMPATRTVPVMRTQNELNRTPATKSHACQTYPTATETRSHTHLAHHVQQELNNPPQTRHACNAPLQRPVMPAVEGRKQPSFPSYDSSRRPKAAVMPVMPAVEGRKHPSCPPSKAESSRQARHARSRSRNARRRRPQARVKPVMPGVEGRKHLSNPSCPPRGAVEPVMPVIKGRKHPSCPSCPSKPPAHHQRPQNVSLKAQSTNHAHH